MSKLSTKVFVFVVACVAALLLGIIVASVVGCKHKHTDNTTIINPPPNQPVITCTIQPDGRVLISAHVDSMSKIYREDSPETHLATFDQAITILDLPCVGECTYTVENLETGAKNSCSVIVAVPSLSSPKESATVVGSESSESKVVICHNGHTIEIAESALDGHLKHGDYLGTCLPEVCDNGLDDDLDGKVDCLDSECENSELCPVDPPVTPEDCLNGLDDDLDGLVDCLDPECFSVPECEPEPPILDCNLPWQIQSAPYNHRYTNNLTE